MRNLLKALPLGIALPVVLFAASVGPEDAQSNISKWLAKFGAHNLPTWIIDPAVDHRAIYGCLILAALYALLVWIVIPHALKLRTDRRQALQGVPVGTIHCRLADLKVEVRRSDKRSSGRIEVELFNSSEYLLQFHVSTAGNINGVAFAQERVEFDGYINPKSTAYLISDTLLDIPFNTDSSMNLPWVYGIYEYDLNYKTFHQQRYSRRTDKGIRIVQQWEPFIKVESRTVVEIPIRTVFYNEIEE